MEKLLGFIRTNKVVFGFLNLLLYLFYGILIGLAVLPSLALWQFLFSHPLMGPGFVTLLIRAVGVGVGVYLFFLWGLLIFGLSERLLSIGFRPGRYGTDSPVFIRWLVYSGVHTISLALILPYVRGSSFVGLYYKLLGCKLGQDVFINTTGLHDAYLLEVGDNVIIGGATDITCHIFEDGELILDRIKIGSDVLIGANCYIMPGTEIASHVSIGANSLLRKKTVVEERSVYMPLPALPVRQVASLLKNARNRPKK